MEILDAGKRKPGIFVITLGVLILLYKSTKRMVTQPFKFENIQKLSMAENVPSAAALELDEDAKEATRKSHLIIESPSMGLLMRYIIEMNFKAEIDFCQEVSVTEEDNEFDFQFIDLVSMKRDEFARFSSGVVRATTRDLQVFMLEENTFSANIWHEKKAIVTNLGIFLLNVPDVRAIPDFWPWRKINMIALEKPNKKVEANL